MNIFCTLFDRMRTARVLAPGRGTGMLHAVAQGLGLLVVVTAVPIAVVGAPVADAPVPIAWVAVAAGVTYLTGLLARLRWLPWLGAAALAVHATVLSPVQGLLFLPFAALMALALVLLHSRPADLGEASGHG